MPGKSARKPETMPTAAFATLGCKVNQYETQRILDDFEERGFVITEFNTPADVYVVNTCSVTQAAERKSRQMTRKMARQNPNAIVVMTGCYGEMARIKGETVEEAALIVPNHHKMETLRHVLEAYPHLDAELNAPNQTANERRFCPPHPRHDESAGRLQRFLFVLLHSLHAPIYAFAPPARIGGGSGKTRRAGL